MTEFNVSQAIRRSDNLLLAQAYFHEYQNRLDHVVHLALERIRQVLQLPTAGICAVGALHLTSHRFNATKGWWL